MAEPITYHDEMLARGWTWDDESRHYLELGARDRQGCPILNMRVSEWEPGVWVANYGVPGIGYGRFIRHATPIAAADEAEAWLKAVLAPLQFLWLKIEATTPCADPARA